jgi:hypothetical protein
MFRSRSSSRRSIFPTRGVPWPNSLLLRLWPAEPYLASLGLFVAFLAAPTSALRRGLQVSCGCFGSSESLTVGATTLSMTGPAALAALAGLVLAVLATRSPPPETAS